jgi:hypothetical protein
MKGHDLPSSLEHDNAYLVNVYNYVRSIYFQQGYYLCNTNFKSHSESNTRFVSALHYVQEFMYVSACHHRYS